MKRTVCVCVNYIRAEYNETTSYKQTIVINKPLKLTENLQQNIGLTS